MKTKETRLSKKIDSLEQVCDRTSMFSDLHRKIEHMQKCFYYVAEALKEIDRLNSNQVTEYSCKDAGNKDLQKAEASSSVQTDEVQRAVQEERERCARICEEIAKCHLGASEAVGLDPHTTNWKELLIGRSLAVQNCAALIRGGGKWVKQS